MNKRSGAAVLLVGMLVLVAVLYRKHKPGPENKSARTQAASTVVNPPGPDAEIPANPSAPRWRHVRAETLMARLQGAFPSSVTVKNLEQFAASLGLPLARVPGEEGELVSDVIVTPTALLLGPGNPAMETILADELTSPDSEVRQDAVRQLGQLADERADVIVIHRLRTDPTDLVRGEAAMALAQSSNPEVPAVLIHALADPDAWVIDHARGAIAQRGLEGMEAQLRVGMNSKDDNVALECATLLERVYGIEIDMDFWRRFAEK